MILKWGKRVVGMCWFWFGSYRILGFVRVTRNKGLKAYFKFRTKVWVRYQSWNWGFGSHPLRCTSETLRVNKVFKRMSAENVKNNDHDLFFWYLLYYWMIGRRVQILLCEFLLLFILMMQEHLKTTRPNEENFTHSVITSHKMSLLCKWGVKETLLNPDYTICTEVFFFFSIKNDKG